MSENINKDQQGIYFESGNEYYPAQITKSRADVGQVDAVWCEDAPEMDGNNNPVDNIYQKFDTQIPLFKADSYPCAFDLNFISGKGGVYMPTKDPRTWTIGVFISKDEVNNTVTLSVYNENNPATPNIVTAPFVSPACGFPFFMPHPMHGLRHDIADWMTNN